MIKTSVYEKYGFDELIDVLFQRQSYLDNTGQKEKKNQKRYSRQVKSIISSAIGNAFWNDDRLQELEKELKVSMGKRKNPLMLAKKLMNE